MKSFVVLFATCAMLVDGSQPIDYTTAYARAQSGDKPLLVLVTAEWCPPCQTMKATTIPELMSKNAFKDFHYATVDLGKEEKLARKLIGTRGVPQFILFEKNNEKWEKRYLRGIQSAQTVEAFMARSQNRMRMARNTTTPRQ